MSDHYYSNAPNSKSEKREWTFELKGHTFKFASDAGVFSKKEVDFGSRLLIESFAPAEVEGGILDVGCGYGPIGLSLAKCYTNCTVEMVDVNERAMELARENAAKNNISNVVIFKSDVYENVNKQYASILSNPPIRAGKKVVHAILEGAFERLVSGGELWIVIQKKQGAPSALEKLELLFSEVEVVVKKKGYYIIKSKKH
ncbi:class I SAM-dependent methyltransferase [Priestia taiwanensis]|uniref:Methyltransferase n=1 Tax=Priestia taiwanensis TaxID=1347902 RepID=A0A917EU48_9BACI|nr:class I SAM-dependent methyltransferase [Priestia taiwanensis]MBM7365126.1 16S rRNA (guanine1207-N2)-methyltransferase [Priestia taiwanensis]GGE84072.1 methyltransferase [Priestia taiwanensis]